MSRAVPRDAGKREGPIKTERAVRDADGTNPKAVYELKAGENVTGIDWK